MMTTTANTANPGSIVMNQDSTTYQGSNTTHTNSKDFFKSKLKKVDTKKIIDFCNSHFLTSLVNILTIPKNNVGKIPAISKGSLPLYKTHSWREYTDPYGKEIKNCNMAVLIPNGMIIVDIDNQCKEENNNGVDYFTNLLKQNTIYLTIEEYCGKEGINYTSTPSNGYHLYYKYTTSFYKQIKSTFKNCGAIDIKKEGEFIIAPYSVYQGCHPSKIYNKETKKYQGEDLTPHKCGGTNDNCLFKGKQYIPHFKHKPDTREMTNDELANLEEYFKEVPIWIKDEFETEVKFNYTIIDGNISIDGDDDEINIDKIKKNKSVNKCKILDLIDCCKKMFLDKRPKWVCIVWTVKAVFKFLFNEEDEARELVHKYSSTHHKYTYSETDELFNAGKVTSNPLPILYSLANKCDPERYNSIIYPIPIKLDYTPDKIISEKRIPFNTYTDPKTEIIAIQSNMNTGKTYCIPDYINYLDSINEEGRSTKVLVVLFRVSLADSLYGNSKWSKLNFAHYQNITEDKVFTSNKYPRLIIQFDSLHKVMGKYDLLILDEIESTTSHLANGFVKAFQPCFNRFLDYCQKVPKVIALDATLQNSTLSTLFSKRSITKIKNNYNSFASYKAHFTHDKSYFKHQLIEQLKNGKKIVVPTNGEKFAVKLSELCKNIIIKDENGIERSISIGIKTSKLGKEIQTNDWSKFDLFIYSPTIVAGVSFDLEHFDSCFGYFTNKSSDAEFCIQQLVRVRSLFDKTFYIYTPYPFSSISKPIDETDLDNYISNLIHCGSDHLNLDNLTISAYDESVKQDTFYLLFRKMLRKTHLTTLNIHGYIQHILKDHGVKCIKWNKPNSKDKKLLIQKEIETINSTLESIGKRMKIEEVESICNATPIDTETFEKLIKKSSIQLTEEEQKSITRYLYTDTYGLSYNSELKAEDIKDKLKCLQGVRNFNLLKSKLIDESLDKAIQFVEEKHSVIYNSRLNEIADELTTDEEFSEAESDRETTNKKEDENFKRLEVEIKKKNNKIRKVFTKYNKKTTKVKIQYDKKWLKIKHCLHFIKEAGFSSINFNYKTKLNWENLKTYIIKHNKSIQSLFDLDNCKFEEEDNIEDKYIKKSLNKYVNSKLENTLGLKIEKLANSTEYKIFKVC
jgi:hypothetical protein